MGFSPGQLRDEVLGLLSSPEPHEHASVLAPINDKPSVALTRHH
jgi:hypothetical protein